MADPKPEVVKGPEKVADAPKVGSDQEPDFTPPKGAPKWPFERLKAEYNEEADEIVQATKGRLEQFWDYIKEKVSWLWDKIAGFFGGKEADAKSGKAEEIAKKPIEEVNKAPDKKTEIAKSKKGIEALDKEKGTIEDVPIYSRELGYCLLYTIEQGNPSAIHVRNPYNGSLNSYILGFDKKALGTKALLLDHPEMRWIDFSSLSVAEDGSLTGEVEMYVAPILKGGKELETPESKAKLSAKKLNDGLQNLAKGKVEPLGPLLPVAQGSVKDLTSEVVNWGNQKPKSSKNQHSDFNFRNMVGDTLDAWGLDKKYTDGVDGFLGMFEDLGESLAGKYGEFEQYASGLSEVMGVFFEFRSGLNDWENGFAQLKQANSAAEQIVAIKEMDTAIKEMQKRIANWIERNKTNLPPSFIAMFIEMLAKQEADLSEYLQLRFQYSEKMSFSHLKGYLKTEAKEFLGWETPVKTGMSSMLTSFESLKDQLASMEKTNKGKYELTGYTERLLDAMAAGYAAMLDQETEIRKRYAQAKKDGLRALVKSHLNDIDGPAADFVAEVITQRLMTEYNLG